MGFEHEHDPISQNIRLSDKRNNADDLVTTAHIKIWNKYKKTVD